MRITIFPVTTFIFCLSLISATAQDITPATSLVYPGVEGKLVYVTDSLGNRIPDFSNAGYKGGGVSIPYVPVKATVWPVAGDNSNNIQAAIDKLSAMPPDASGFRGAVLLKMGTYPLEKPINIKASGVVLRGEGMSDIGTILIGKTVTEASPPGPGRGGRPALINISGASGWAPREETKKVVVDKYVPVGARSFNVASSKGYKAGDKILVRRNGNEDWIKELGQDTLSVGRYRWRPFIISYDRVVTDVKGNAITIDAPIFCAIETRWGGGDIVKYSDSGRIDQVGVENLRGVSDYNPSVRMKGYGNMDRGSFDKPGSKYEGDEYYSDENHYFNFINFSNAKTGGYVM